MIICTIFYVMISRCFLAYCNYFRRLLFQLHEVAALSQQTRKDNERLREDYQSIQTHSLETSGLVAGIRGMIFVTV